MAALLHKAELSDKQRVELYEGGIAWLIDDESHKEIKLSPEALARLSDMLLRAEQTEQELGRAPEQGVLVDSINEGRLALDNAEHGPDLTSNQAIDVWLAGRWIAGHVQHNYDGYFFVALDGSTCGLIEGMKVRLK